MNIRPAHCLAVLTASVLLAGCQTTAPAPASAASAEVPTTLLISLDGFHPSYLTAQLAPNLTALAEAGVRAEWMTPSYPSLTFPNHYSIVTGLRPDQHGLVNNTMEDAQLGSFSLSNREAVGDSRWWQGIPAWVSVERAGLPTATLFWPGSEAAIDGVRPTRWTPFDSNMPINTRVDTVLGWLREPASTRPRLATLYFEHVDSAGHGFGPDSPQARAAVAEVDTAIGRLVDGMRRDGVYERVNLIITSDHGMAAVPAGSVVALEEMASPENARAITGGQSVGFTPLPGRQAQAEAQLLGRHDHYECWRKGELPARWHYGSHPRIPAIVCQMDEGVDARSREHIARFAGRTGTRGSHGFDPALPSMRAIFIAHGPAFSQGVVIRAFDNVDVYPLLMQLVQVPAAPNAGDIAVFAEGLRVNGE